MCLFKTLSSTPANAIFPNLSDIQGKMKIAFHKSNENIYTKHLDHTRHNNNKIVPCLGGK